MLLNNSAEEIELRSEELEKIRNQLSERKKQVEEKESEINSLEQELVRAKRNLDRFRAEEKRIETELESIRRSIESSTNKAVNNILIGMTPSEVIKVAGRPRVIDDCGSDEYYNYGKVWAIFESGIVSIMVSSRVFTRCRSANRYKSKGNGIIKY
ncbi:MAG TPA: hypothetical protein DD671_19310 [Balneolaceae bacterium]|nr:hypothetical protein [Balneolaceae bacterium]